MADVKVSDLFGGWLFPAAQFEGDVISSVSLNRTPPQVQVKLTICSGAVQLGLPPLTGLRVLDWQLVTGVPCDPLSLSMWEDDRTERKHRTGWVSTERCNFILIKNVTKNAA